MCVLFINPHKVKILKTIQALERVFVKKIIVLGNLDVIKAIKESENISFESEVINVREEDLVDVSRSYLNKDTIVIFGDCLETYQKRILGNDHNDSINYFYVADMLDIKNLIFISSYSKKRHLDFEDKRRAITSVFDFMKSLGVKKSNVCLLTDKTISSDILEVNLIRMILKDEMAKSVNILSPAKLSEVFDSNSDCNVYNKNVNMLIFKNYEITKTFVDTLSLMRNIKVASICSLNNYCYINAGDVLDEADIMFSLLLINKYLDSFKLELKMAAN